MIRPPWRCLIPSCRMVGERGEHPARGWRAHWMAKHNEPAPQPRWLDRDAKPMAGGPPEALAYRALDGKHVLKGKKHASPEEHAGARLTYEEAPSDG